MGVQANETFPSAPVTIDRVSLEVSISAPLLRSQRRPTISIVRAALGRAAPSYDCVIAVMVTLLPAWTNHSSLEIETRNDAGTTVKELATSTVRPEASRPSASIEIFC